MKKILLKILKVCFVIILIGIIVLLVNFFLNKNIFITKYQINSNEIPNNFDGYKIAQLTDIHSIRNIKQKDKIVQKVKNLNPDVIFVTGDLIDATYYSNQNDMYLNNQINLPDSLTIDFMVELTDITNVYFIYGNHEMMLLDDPEKNAFKVAIEDAGIKILNNKTDKLTIDKQTINLVGIQDPATLYKDKKYAYVGEKNYDKVKQILDDLFTTNTEESNDENTFTIALSHRPEYFDLYTNYPINLLLSGHTHGGVVKIPFVGGIYAHPQGWFPEYTSGMYKKDKFHMIVGRGIGYSKIPIRIFNPPEIIEITLHFT